MVSGNSFNSFKQLQKAARSTLNEVLNTGLKTCEDQSGNVDDMEGFIPAGTGRIKADDFQPRIWGTAKFDVCAEWISGGRRIAKDQTCDQLGGHISITAWYKNQPLPVKVEWARAYQGMLLGDIPVSPNSCSCPITADEVRCVVKATVTAQRAGSNMGIAFVEIGPFDMDVSMKESLMTYLENQKASFSVYSTAGEAYNLYVSSELISLQDTQGNTISTSPVRSSSSMARLDLDNCEVLTLEMHDANYRLVSASQRQRDTIVLAIRAFQAIKTCNFQLLMEQVLKNTHSVNNSTDSHLMITDIDLLVILEAMAMHSVSAMQFAQKAEKERMTALKVRDTLEKDLNETIESYRQVLMEASQRSPAEVENMTKQLSTSETILLQNKLKEAETQSKAYLSEMEQHRLRIIQLQQKIAEKDQQLQAWMNNAQTSTAEKTIATPVPPAEEIARHLDELSTSTKFVDRDQTTNHQELTIKQLESRVQQLSKKLDEATADREYLNKKNLELTSRLDSRSPTGAGSFNYSALSNSVSKTDKVASIMQRNIEMYQSRVADLEQSVARLESELASKDTMTNTLKKENERLNNQLTFTALNPGYTTTAPSILDLNTVADFQTTQTGGMTKILQEKSALEKKVSALQDENRKLQAEVASLKTIRADLEAKIRKAVTA